MYKIGYSIDIHNIKKQKNSEVILGGTIINTDYKIESVSDGDIILHSIAEAIYGALGLGDLGDHFDDNNISNINLNSEIILNDALLKMKNKKYKLVNIDIVVISQHIYLKKYKSTIKDKLTLLLGSNNINIKATRWESNKMQIQCSCSLLIKKKLFSLKHT